jgi:hypothetical protein
MQCVKARKLFTLNLTRLKGKAGKNIRAMKTYGGMAVQSHVFLTLALDGAEEGAPGTLRTGG